MRVVVHRQVLKRYASDYAVALALMFEVSVLYGGFKMATKLKLVHVQNGNVAQASMPLSNRERERE